MPGQLLHCCQLQVVAPQGAHNSHVYLHKHTSLHMLGPMPMFQDTMLPSTLPAQRTTALLLRHKDGPLSNLAGQLLPGPMRTHARAVTAVKAMQHSV